MMPLKRPLPLAERLPSVRGTFEADADLGKLTWFRVGGPAEILFKPADEEDLTEFIANLDEDIPLTVLGVGSNLLIRDGGIEGVVIRLGKALAGISVSGGSIAAGAGALDITVASKARDAGIAGLEFLRGIPGTIGGALRMNAGAYGREMKDILQSARAVDRRGKIQELTLEDMGYGYRKSAIPEDWTLLSAVLKGAPGDPAAIARRMAEIAGAREESQPLRTRTGGSTFKNPAGGEAGGRSAWQLIDLAGCRGLALGDATVSDKHCNFLINRGRATARELETLGEMVRRRVKEATGVTLEWEIRIIGIEKGEGQ